MMNLKISGNPGTDNHFEDINMQHVGSYNPNATDVHIHNQHSAAETRLASWFRKLKSDFQNNICLQQKLDDIKCYRTKLPRTIGLKAKLQDGGFSPMAIEKACRLKQRYAKKSIKYQYFEAAQRIDGYLFAVVSSRFDTYVLPLIEAHRSVADINVAVYEQVVMPVMEELNANGADDTHLCYTADDIFGMIYYLTGNCHINWAIYDV